MSSKLITTLEPKFYSEFECIGDKCPDHCCHSWGVTVNKHAYKKLRKHKDPVVKQIANEHFNLLDDGVEAKWAVIQMDKEGLCPALDKSGLCELQKRCGHKKLPHTCQDYPRVAKFFGDRIEMSLVMSCPSAAESILFNYSAMMFDEQKRKPMDIMHGKAGGFTAKNIPEWLPVIRDFCFELTVDQSSTFDERLFTIGMFLKQASTRLYDIKSLLGLVDTYREIQGERKTQEMYARLKTAENLKWHVFADLDNYLRNYNRSFPDRVENKGLSSSSLRFQQCREQMIWLIHNDGVSKPNPSDGALMEFSERNIEGSVEIFSKILDDGAEQYLNPYFEDNPQVLTNYVLYYLYNYQFLAANDKTPFEFYKAMVVDIFMLRSYLSGIAVNQQQVTQEWIIKLFQSYSRRRQHNESFVVEIEKRMAERGSDSAGAIFSLLK